MKSKPLLELFCAFFASLMVIHFNFSENKNFETLAFGTQTVSYQSTDSHGTLNHIIKINNEESQQLIKGWENRGKKSVMMILGNSQTHSINQKKDKETNYVEALQRKFLNKNIDVICTSFPNASLQEFYLSYLYWKNKLPIQTVVVPVFMDDLREDGVRGDVFFSDLIDERFLIKDSSDYLPRKINKELQVFWHNKSQEVSLSENNDMAALSETFQEKTETWLNTKLSENFSIWNHRANIRGDFFNWLYKARNTILRIDASTVRKMIPQRYVYNIHALELIVEDCIASNIKVYLYIPPIRFDVKLPYDEGEYHKFKNEILVFANRYPQKVKFKNLESVIPGELWGYKEATNLTSDKEIDYMHFQFKGHQILADSLVSFINSAY